MFDYKPPVAGSGDQDNDPSSYVKTKNFSITERNITRRKTVFVIKIQFPLIMQTEGYGTDSDLYYILTSYFLLGLVWFI
jgi:hypothetical protein